MNRKRSLSKRLSRRDPDDIEFVAAITEFHEGSDRVAAIMGAALVDNSLMKAIESVLQDRSETGALFHDRGAPFGTLDARTVAAKALGLITAPMREDLDTVRDIRNQFAHALLKLDFENEDIVTAAKFNGGYPTVDGPARKLPPAREMYENACMGISLHLIRRCAENWKVIRDRELGRRALAQVIAAGKKGGGENVLYNVRPDKP